MKIIAMNKASDNNIAASLTSFSLQEYFPIWSWQSNKNEQGCISHSLMSTKQPDCYYNILVIIKPNSTENPSAKGKKINTIRNKTNKPQNN